MNPKEINKKIAELLHTRLNLINGESLPSEELQKEVEGATKEITDKVFGEISALPVINGWAARDWDGSLWLYLHKPTRGNEKWCCGGTGFMQINATLLPSLGWEDEPIEIELPIIVIK